MIGKQDSQERNIKNVSTKIPIWVADLLNIICQARGTDIYGLMQLVLEFIIETAKVSGPVPPQMKTLLNMLKMDADWNKAFSFSNPTATLDVAQVILVLQQSSKDGKPSEGFGLAMINKPWLPGETPQMTLCVDDILERITEVSMKGLYDELRRMGALLKTDSMRETLTLMCDAQLQDSLREMDAAEMPGYGQHHDYGKAIEYGRRFKRKHHRTPDSVANSQQRIIFDDYDRDIADYEAKDWEGEIRQREEPPTDMSDL